MGQTDIGSRQYRFTEHKRYISTLVMANANILYCTGWEVSVLVPLESSTMGSCLMVVANEYHVSRGATTSRSEQVSHCHHCYALQMTEVNGKPSQQRRLSEYPNDARIFNCIKYVVK